MTTTMLKTGLLIALAVCALCLSFGVVAIYLGLATAFGCVGVAALFMTLASALERMLKRERELAQEEGPTP